LGPILFEGISNLAYKRPVSADSGWGCCPDSNALIDGQIQNTSWQNGFAWTGGNSCYSGGCPAGFKQATIDLGSTQTVVRLDWWTHDVNSVPLSWKVEVSQDGKSFAEVYSTSSPMCRGETLSFNIGWYYPACGQVARFTPVQVRYVRYRFDDRTLFRGLHGWAAEVEVFGSPDPVIREPVALSIPAPGVLGNDISGPGDVLQALLAELPTKGALKFNTDGSFIYLPQAGFSGTDSFTYKSNNEGKESNLATVTISVFNSSDNHAPAITSTPPAGGKAEKLYSYPVAATDPDAGDALTYTFASGIPTGMSIEAASGLLQWTPTVAQVGTHSGIIIKVADQNGLFATQTINITVKPANRAPVINSSAPTIATENEPYIYAVQASDPDAGDTLTYSLPTAPAGMTINSNTGLISWTPASAQIGEHPVIVLVQDQDGLQVSQSYTVKVDVASIIVPNVEGVTLAAAQTALTAAQLKLGNVLNLYDETVPAGLVLSQQPLGGASVAKNTAVDLIVSQGPAPVSVPSVVGFTQAAAESALLAARLAVGTVTSVNSDTVPAGVVISQNPSAATPVPKNTTVDLVVSSGPALVTTPNVTGFDEAAARAALLADNLTIGTVGTASSDAIPAGQVISQNPAAGVKLAKGSAVDLVVSSGPAAPGFAAIQVLPESPLLLTGETLSLSALAILDDGTSQSLSGETWTSATPSVATVNASGVVTALAEGQTVISAQKDGVRRQLPCPVGDNNLDRLTDM